MGDTDSKRSRRRTDGGRRTASRDTAVDAPVGDALRSVYDQAVGEAIPQEMLDLLGKLG